MFLPQLFIVCQLDELAKQLCYGRTAPDVVVHRWTPLLQGVGFPRCLVLGGVLVVALVLGLVAGLVAGLALGLGGSAEISQGVFPCGQRLSVVTTPV